MHDGMDEINLLEGDSGGAGAGVVNEAQGRCCLAEGVEVGAAAAAVKAGKPQQGTYGGERCGQRRCCCRRRRWKQRRWKASGVAAALVATPNSSAATKQHSAKQAENPGAPLAERLLTFTTSKMTSKRECSSGKNSRSSSRRRMERAVGSAS